MHRERPGGSQELDKVILESPFDPSPRAVRSPDLTRKVLVAVTERLKKEHSYAVCAIDASVEELEELEQNEDDPGFGWSAEDAQGAFDEEGKLVRTLPLYCTPFCTQDLQVAFAYLGLAPHLPLSDSNDDPSLSPDANERSTDLISLVRAFDLLRQAGIEAEPCFSISLTNGLAELEMNGPVGAIFWHSQSHEAFDADGNLSEDLCLHWRGDKDALAEALQTALVGAGLKVKVPKNRDTAFMISRQPG